MNRFRIIETDSGISPRLDENGDWVLWRDVAAMEAEIEALKQDIDRHIEIASIKAARVKELESLMRKAHAVMRECGWQLAIGCEPQGDGILEAACTEIEADFADALSAARRALEGGE